MTRSGRPPLGWLWLIVLAAMPSAQAPPEQPRVLLLLETSGFTAADLFAQGLAEKLRDMPEDVDLFVELLDVNRFGGAQQDAIFAEFLRHKYANVQLDLLVAGGPGALDFTTRYRAPLFAGVPVVFAAVSETNPVLAELPDDTTGIVSHFDLTGTLELALSLQPQATGVAVISGSAPFDRLWNARAQQRLSEYEGRLDVQYLAGLPLDGLLAQVGTLPRDTIVILTTIIEDGAGRRFIPAAEAVSPVTAASSAPVYGLYETHVGRGIVGGYVDSFQALGAETAVVAQRILAGERATDIPVRRTPGEYAVDWRQMQRFGLDEARLPPGTVVLFREPTLWSEYKWAIVATLVVLLLQAATIGALLAQRRRMRDAEARRRENELRFLAQLAHINRVAAMGEFAGSMAHELTQPLSAILNNADFAAMQLETGAADSAQLREVIEDIRADDRRAVEIIRSMRRFMKRQEVVMKPVELKPLVEEVLKFAAVQAHGRRVTLTFEPDRDLPTIAGDRVHLQQVLMNLILNAMDAVGAAGNGQGTVLVTARREGTGSVTISVSDTGNGIPADRLEAVFNPFYTTKKDGIGMGLAIIRTIVEAHGGRVWAENGSRGGAVFHFTLPVAAAEQARAGQVVDIPGEPAPSA